MTRFKKLLAVGILPLVLLLFFNRVANWHFHQLPNGIVIEHAHPYSKSAESPFERHQHSDLDYLILDLVFRATLFLLSLALLVSIFIRLIACVRKEFIVFLLPEAPLGIPSLRAPPVF